MNMVNLIELALNELNFKTLNERRTQFIASLMHKITHGLAPKKLIDIFQKTLSSHNYNLRGSTTKLYLPKPLKRLNILKKVLVTEEQNCGMGSRTSREIYNLSVTLNNFM